MYILSDDIIVMTLDKNRVLNEDRMCVYSKIKYSVKFHIFFTLEIKIMKQYVLQK